MGTNETINMLKENDFSWHVNQPDVPGKSAGEMKKFLDDPIHKLLDKINQILGGDEAQDLTTLGSELIRVSNGTDEVRDSVHYNVDRIRELFEMYYFLQNWVKLLDGNKQDYLIAGQNIVIDENNVITAQMIQYLESGCDAGEVPEGISVVTDGAGINIRTLYSGSYEEGDTVLAGGGSIVVCARYGEDKQYQSIMIFDGSSGEISYIHNPGEDTDTYGTCLLLPPYDEDNAGAFVCVQGGTLGYSSITEESLGDIETALDHILSIQQTLIGGTEE